MHWGLRLEKTGHEKSKYQHPEYYNKPASMGMDYGADASKSRQPRGENRVSRP